MRYKPSSGVSSLTSVVECSSSTTSAAEVAEVADSTGSAAVDSTLQTSPFDVLQQQTDNVNGHFSLQFWSRDKVA